MTTSNQKPQKTLTFAAGAAVVLSGFTMGAQPAAAFSVGPSHDPIGGTGAYCHADCTLQGELDYLVVDGDFYDVNTEETGYEYFTNTATGLSAARFMFEIAGFANENKFGIFNHDGDLFQIFDGINGAGDGAVLDFFADGTVKNLVTGDSLADFGNVFGYYIETPENNIFYSDRSWNPGGGQYSAIYQGKGDITMKSWKGGSPGLFTDNEFIVAFEDRIDDDWDYNDLVVMVESVHPVEKTPEPSLMLGLSGLAGSMLLARKRKQS